MPFGAASATARGLIALSCFVMNDDSSWRALAVTLSEEVEALPPGTRIPTHRALVARFGASATTVSRALASLSRAGLVETRPGSGTFRCATRVASAAVETGWQEAALGITPGTGAKPSPVRVHDARALGSTLGSHGSEVVDLNGGYPHPDLQPLDLLSKALGRVGRRTEAWERPDAAGLPGLRDWFATEIGAGLARHDVLVTSGGQAALSLTMRAVAPPGDPVIVETPTYPGILAAARGAGLRPIAVPVDAEGVQPSHLERALTQTGARVVIVQPTSQNPTGVTLAQARHGELIDLAVQHGAFIVEDDFARYLAHSDAGPLPQPLVARDPAGVVIHIRSLTKATSPNLRIAGVAARGPVMARLRAAHTVDTMFVPAVLQHTALEVVASAAWPRAVRALSAALAHRRATTADAIRAHMPAGTLTHEPRGGYHLWIRTPAGVDSTDLSLRALQLGVAVAPGPIYTPAGSLPDRLRISYVAAPSMSDIGVGIRRLCEALTQST